MSKNPEGKSGQDILPGENSRNPDKFLQIFGRPVTEKEGRQMCCSTKGSACQCPEELKQEPEECTPEQIEKCHGTKEEHPCIPKERKKD